MLEYPIFCGGKKKKKFTEIVMSPEKLYVMFPNVGSTCMSLFERKWWKR